jgi:hypothetical protein
MPKTPLHSAAQSGNMQQVMGLLRDGAAVTCWDKVSQPSRTPNACAPSTFLTATFATLAGRMDSPAPRVPAQPLRCRARAGQPGCRCEREEQGVPPHKPLRVPGSHIRIAP